MTTICRILFVCAIAFSANTSSYAQVYVREKPVAPKHEKINQPSPNHIWVEEEWEPKNKSYEFAGCKWIAPPKDKTAWVPGHWAEKKRGWVWIPGHWTEKA